MKQITLKKDSGTINGYFIESNKIKVFPAEQRDPAINAESSLMTENNITQVVRLRKKSYTISDVTDSSRDLELFVNGYQFICSDNTADFKSVQTAAIITRRNNISGQSDQTTYSLGNIYISPRIDSNNTDTLRDVDVVIDGVQYFSGLVFFKNETISDIEKILLDSTEKLYTLKLEDDRLIQLADLEKDSVDNEKIQDNAVQTRNIKDSNVTTPKIKNKAVTNSKIDDDAVTNDKIADNSIDSDQIQENVILNRHLTTDSVTNTKIKNDEITGSKIKNNQISANHLIANSVTESKISTDAVTTDKIKNLNVVDSKINDLDGDKIWDNSISNSKLIDGINGSKIVNETLTTEKFNKNAVINGALKLYNDNNTTYSLDTNTFNFVKIEDGKIVNNKNITVGNSLTPVYVNGGQLNYCTTSIVAPSRVVVQYDNITTIGKTISFRDGATDLGNISANTNGFTSNRDWDFSQSTLSNINTLKCKNIEIDNVETILNTPTDQITVGSNFNFNENKKITFGSNVESYRSGSDLIFKNNSNLLKLNPEYTQFSHPIRIGNNALEIQSNKIYYGNRNAGYGLEFGRGYISAQQPLATINKLGGYWEGLPQKTAAEQLIKDWVNSYSLIKDANRIFSTTLSMNVSVENGDADRLQGNVNVSTEIFFTFDSNNNPRLIGTNSTPEHYYFEFSSAYGWDTENAALVLTVTDYSWELRKKVGDKFGDDFERAEVRINRVLMSGIKSYLRW